MDIKESIISSFFFHLILFLLMIAAANYTAGLSQGTRNIITLDLAMPDKDQPAAPHDPANKAPADFSAPFDDNSHSEMTLPDRALSNPPEEAKIVPEPEKKTESAVDPAKAEKAELPPVRTEGFPSMEAYYEFIILHTKIFREQAGARVNELLGEAFKVNKREFYGGTAIVNLKFGPDRKLNAVIVDSASPELKSFLDEIVWGIVPPPAAYSLGNTGVQIEFSVHEGYMSFNINTL